MKNVEFRRVFDDDLEILNLWLNKDYVKKWYNEPEDWLAEINGRNKEFSWINHFIVMSNGNPIGFCQYYDCFDGQKFEDWYSIDSAGKMYSIDYLIGDENYLGKGYGSLIVKVLTELVATKEQAAIIVVQPDEENSASNRVLLSNNYTFDPAKHYYYKLLK